MKFKFWLFFVLFFSSVQVFAICTQHVYWFCDTESEAYQKCVTDKNAAGATTQACKRNATSNYWSWSAVFLNPYYWTTSCLTDQPINPSTGACSISPKDAGQPEICDNGTNPVNGANGNKFQVETDYTGAGQSGLELKRYYNSSYDSFFSWPSLGHGWRHTYTRQLIFIDTEVAAIRPDGHGKSFVPNGSGGWQAKEADTNDKLVVLTNETDAYQLTLADDTVEKYNTNGQVTKITPRGGVTQSLAYDTQGRLSTVDDGYGHKLTFNYDPANPKRLISITTPDGKLIQYSYTADDLTSVTYPDTKQRIYHYDETAYSASTEMHKLTGITDERAIRFATYYYDSQGRSIRTQHYGGAEKATLTYNTDGTTTIENALGLKRTYTFQNILGVLKNTSITQPCSSCGSDSASTGYNSTNGNVLRRTDFRGNFTCYTYNTRNLEIVRVEGFASTITTCPADLVNYTPTTGTTQRKISTQWHATWRVPVLIAEPKRITTFSWGNAASTCGAVGVLCGKTEQATTDTNGGNGFSATKTGLARSNSYTYNARGQILTADEPRPDTDVIDKTTFEYYPDDYTVISNRKMLRTVKNALNHVTTYSNYDAHGYAHRIVDANNVITDIIRDARNRIYTVTITAQGATPRKTNFRYYANGLLQQVITPNQGTIFYSYDGAHRLKSILNGTNEKVSYTTLDGLGNRTLEETFAPGATTASTTINRQFDAFGRLWKVLDAVNKEVQVYTYNSQEKLGTITAKPDDDPTHNQLTSYTNYDALNRLRTLKDAILGVTSLGYDGLDHLVAVKDPRSHSTSYAIDGLDNQKQEVSPDRGTISSTDPSAFDEAGNLKIKTDARSKTTLYAYDALNRLLSETYADSTSVKYQYDIGTGAKGRLNNITDPTGKTDFVYDTEGRLKQKTQTTGTVIRSVTYGYDSTTGRLNSIQYPSGLIIKYDTFDTAGRVASLSIAGTVVLDTVTYQPLSGVKSYNLPRVTATGTTITHGYDANGYIVSYTLADATKTLERDRLGNVTGIRNAGAATNNSTYAYDKLNRLTDLTITSAAQSYQYGYDGLGNRTSKTFNGSTTTYVPNTANNRFATINGVTQVYDAAGNLTGNGTLTWGYNDRGRLANVKLASGTVYNYGINGLGQRITKTSTAIATGKVIFVYDEAGHLIGEYNNSGARLWEHVYLGDRPVAVIDSAGTVFYVLTDHLNTPRQIIDSAKNLRWRWDNTEPFGANGANQNPAGLGVFGYNLRFPGQYFDSETGLHYNAFRDYDPKHGRYLESDPVGLEGGLNTYGYVWGNPINLSDSLGLRPPNVEESNFIKKYFGKCIDPQSMDINIREWFDIDRALSLDGGFISFPPNYFIDNNPNNGLKLSEADIAKYFGHEVLHQLQRNNGIYVTAYGIMIQPFHSLGFFDPYQYILSSDSNQMLQNFLNGNPESQAQMFQDYIMKNMTGGNINPYRAIAAQVKINCSCKSE